jgi:DNA polymerase-1
MATSAGQTTNAVYGFLSMFIKILEDLHPYGLAVAFDKGPPSHRLDQFEEYKAHRPPMPDELQEQIRLIEALLDEMGVVQLGMEGYEADDILATLALRIAGQGDEALIVTSDKDMMQLVGENIKVVANRKGLTDVIIFDRDRVLEKFGVPPERIPDFLALKGDASDNVPGVPGIGDKTAAGLIKRYGGIEQIYGSLDEIKEEKVRRRLVEGRERAMLGLQLVKLVEDLPLDMECGDCALKPWDGRKVRDFLASLEIRALADRLDQLAGSIFPKGKEDTDKLPTSHEQPAGGTQQGWSSLEETDLQGLLEEASRIGRLCLYTQMEGAGRKAQILKLVALSGNKLMRLAAAGAGDEALRQALDGIAGCGAALVGHSAKGLLLKMLEMGMDMPKLSFDCELAAYLLDPVTLDYRLQRLASYYLGLTVEEGAPQQLTMEREETDEVGADARDTWLLSRLEERLGEELRAQRMDELMREIELPLQRVLADMEHAGVCIDRGMLQELSARAGRRIKDIEQEIYGMAGEAFNVNSTKQLGRILFDKLGLEPVKKTKTGYSTDAEVLESLAGKHPMIPLLLESRELVKLKGTYLDALPRLVDPETGRLHTSFNQTVTSTGRLSSSNPNLQNIPVRGAAGAEIRRAFVPGRDADWLVVADYSQIELRILAHLSGDPGMSASFMRNEDIHARTASEVFGVPLEDVGSEQRRKAKAINFGLLYGMGPSSLAKQIGASEQEARDYIEAYFRRYPAVKEYLDEAVRRAEERGWTETIMGRRRRLPELRSENGRTRSLGMRLAMNSPIQGSAADIIKIAMVRIAALLKDRALQSRLILQVHDELLLEVPEAELEEVMTLVRREMEGAVRLSVPLLVDLGFGKNWKDAKPS